MPLNNPLERYPSMELAGNFASAQGGVVSLAHGKDATKIRGWIVAGQSGGGADWVGAAYNYVTGYQFDAYIDATNFNVALHPTNSASLVEKAWRAILFFEP